MLDCQLICVHTKKSLYCIVLHCALQGPPGTGKTYIGLKVVQVLLENSHVWNAADPAENSPILVVCYTNHALDQFLEGLTGFLRRGIVRVGGRSKCKNLEQFLLRELRKRSRESRTVPRGIFLNRREARSDMELQQVEIEHQTAIIESTERGLIHEDVLKSRCMFEGHYEDLTNMVDGGDDGGQASLFAPATLKYGKSVLPLWLGLDEMIYSEQGVNPDHMEQGPAADQPAEEAEEEEDMENAAQAEAAERILENQDDEAAVRRQEEERRRRQNEQRAEEQLAVNFDHVLHNDAVDVDAQGR